MISRRCSSIWEGLLQDENSTLVPQGGGTLKAAVMFPSQYPVAMANLGFQIVYRIVAEHPRWRADRFFAPPQDLRLEENQEIPSFEERIPLSEFNLVAVSVSFENDLVNMIRLLEQAGIPPRREERGANHPFILVGGIVPSANPEPFAPFADAILVGEAEEALPQFLSLLEENWEEGQERQLMDLAQVEGLYLPQLYSPCYDSFGRYRGMEPLKDYASMPIPRTLFKNFGSIGARSCITSPHSHFSSMDLLEISRGCPNLCRFCLAAHLNTPARFVEREPLMDGISASGERVGLVGTSIWPPAYVVDAVELAMSEGREVSFSSLRVDAPLRLFEAVRQSGALTATLGVESAAEERRRRAGKGFSNAFLESRVLELANLGFENLKLYFMVGLPPLNPAGEAEEIVVLVRRLAHLIRTSRLNTRLGISVSSFVPKPHTPFQREPMAEKDELTRAIRAVGHGLKREKGVSITWELPKWSILQGLVSRGDRQIGEVLYQVAMGDSLRRALARNNCNLHHYLHREREPQEALPWEVVDPSTGRVTRLG